ncbi:MAG: HD domain-containing protein [Nitrosopumilus sp. H13]|nr:MAG: HD domain-containing protein [Nitrosopumilus sp. H13]
MSRKTFQFKAVRDPLYGFIGLSETETKIIDTAVFRRLQFIKQLSHAYVVYPSAIHTRFEHSLGVVHVSDMMARELNIEPNEIGIIRLSCLLHDIGHGPFSHLFENIMTEINDIPEPHEVISRIMIQDDPEIKDILDSDTRKLVSGLLEKDQTLIKTPLRSLQSDIVSSGLDADKLDYLRRDSYHIGVMYGQFDFYRVLHTIVSTRNGTRICIDNKGKDALENYRLARYLMHVQVYEHHTRLSADQMFLRALEIAIEDGVIDKQLLQFSLDGNNSKFLENYKSLDDHSIYQMILNDERATDSKKILGNIKRRRLLKRACEFTSTDLEDDADVDAELMKMKYSDYRKIEREIAQEIDVEPHQVIFYKSKINNKLYKKGELLCKIGDQIRDIDKISPISGKDTTKFLVFGHRDKDIREKILDKVSDRFKIDKKKIRSIS